MEGNQFLAFFLGDFLFFLSFSFFLPLSPFFSLPPEDRMAFLLFSFSFLTPAALPNGPREDTDHQYFVTEARTNAGLLSLSLRACWMNRPAASRSRTMLGVSVVARRSSTSHDATNAHARGITMAIKRNWWMGVLPLGCVSSFSF